MYIINLLYKKDLAIVEKFSSEHIKFLATNYEQGKFIVSGAKVPGIGKVILAKVKERDELEKIIKQDPFIINDVARYEIIEFIPNKYNEKFNFFLDNGDKEDLISEFETIIIGEDQEVG